MALPVSLTLRRLGDGLRARRNKVVQQRLPWMFIDLLCRLDERESDPPLQVDDRVWLGGDDRLFTVVEHLDGGQVRCRDASNGRPLIVAARDLRKVEADEPQ
jgi:hypothetical protein